MAELLLMKGDLIPDDDHVTRYVSGSKIAPSGRITGAAFQLRTGEESLSVNWLEFLDLENRDSEIQQIRNVFVDKGRTLQAKAKFAVLNVGKTKTYVRQESQDNRLLSVQHDPEDLDLSHSGIFNIPEDDPSVGDIIAELIGVNAIYPARDNTN